MASSGRVTLHLTPTTYTVLPTGNERGKPLLVTNDGYSYGIKVPLSSEVVRLYKLVFNVHINGAFHCSLRYRQLHSFHEQLKKQFSSNNLPLFPPKKLLSLSPLQLEERRLLLEKYVQIVSQDPEICNSDTFNGFLLSAQQETQREQSEDVVLDVYLLNGHKISVNIVSTDETEDVLEVVASQIELPDDFVYYFGLYLIKIEEGDNSVVRKLQDFESPYISLKAANKHGRHRIILRKSYWDQSYEDHLLDNKVALNLLYVQAVVDLERQWILATEEQKKHLANLQQRGSKREYLRLARTLKYYGCLLFQPCLTDYPRPNTRVLLSIGNKELSFRIQASTNQIKEASFRITRMRCWRITTIIPETNEEGFSDEKPQLELAFEYLMAKDTLKWITITSDQAILLSMCLQSMVDDLLSKKQGKKIKKPQDRLTKGKGGSGKDKSSLRRQIFPSKIKEEKVTKSSQSNNQEGSVFTENEIFADIGDDDL